MSEREGITETGRRVLGICEALVIRNKQRTKKERKRNDPKQAEDEKGKKKERKIKEFGVGSITLEYQLFPFPA